MPNQNITLAGWNAVVHLPASYTANPTKKYPALIFFPGTGEVGTDVNKVKLHGPNAYVEKGWNGNITVDGKTVEFIVVSVQPPSAWTRPQTLKPKLDLLLSQYRIDPKQVNLTGLSNGGWVSNIFATYKPTATDNSYTNYVANIINVQGVIPADRYDATPVYPTNFDVLAQRGVKELGFEQIYDGRYIDVITNRMNSIKAGTGIHIKTQFGNGGHCCWERFYGNKTTEPNKFTIEGQSQNIYEWLARQVLAGTPQPPVNTPPTVNAGVDFTKTLPDNTAWIEAVGQDAEGALVYNWTVKSGTASIAHPNQAATLITNLVEGEVVLEVTVTDVGGLKASDTVRITVLPEPLPEGFFEIKEDMTLDDTHIGKVGLVNSAAQVILNLAFKKASLDSVQIVKESTSILYFRSNSTILNVDGLTETSLVNTTIAIQPLPKDKVLVVGKLK